MQPWSWAFRRGLGPALDDWEAEGLVSPEAADVLRARYELARGEAAEHANLAVYLLGALLVFGGMSSFVAWNWAAMPAFLKLAVGIGTMLSAELAGFAMLRGGRREGLGHALVFAGALGFGANLALVAQIYHLQPSGDGLLAWAAASLGVALAVRSLPCGALAASLVFLWVLARAEDLPGGLLTVHALWIAVVLIGRWVRSDALVALALVGGALTVGLVASGDRHFVTLVYEVPLGFAAAAIGLAARRGDIGNGLVRLGAGFSVVFAFVVSFGFVAEEVSSSSGHLDSLGLLLALAPPLLAGAVSIARASAEARPALVIGMACIVALLLAPRLGEAPTWLAAHAVLLAKVVWDLRRSLAELERGPFWSGLLLGVAVIVARFLELQTDLLVKAACFVVAGVVVLIAGHEFEKRRRGHEV